MLPAPQSLETLRKILKQRGITHDRLAYALGTSGPRICRAINGYCRFSADEKVKIAAFLGASVAKLFKEENQVS
jgi:plasmid maintenance system antidote protein VapI